MSKAKRIPVPKPKQLAVNISMICANWQTINDYFNYPRGSNGTSNVPDDNGKNDNGSQEPRTPDSVSVSNVE